MGNQCGSSKIHRERGNDRMHVLEGNDSWPGKMPWESLMPCLQEGSQGSSPNSSDQCLVLL